MANETTHQEENIDKKNGRVTKALLAAETRGDREGFDRLLAYSQHKPHADGRKKNTGAALDGQAEAQLCAPSILICAWPRKITAPAG